MKTLLCLWWLCAGALGLGHAQGSGKALHFTGPITYFAVQDDAALRLTTHFSLSAWVKTGKDSGTILSKTDFYTPWPGFAFGIGPNAGGLPAFWPNNVDSWQTAATRVDDDQWHHLAVSINGNQLQFYVDGKPDGGPILLSTAIGTSAEALRCGYEQNPFASPRFFNGTLDEVCIWNRALSQDEIRHRMCQKLTGTEPGLVAYYRMDEGTDNTCPGGQDVCDASGNGHHGIKF
jgi:hypothetical protein